MTIGEMMGKRRKELGMTLEDVGKAVGVSKSTVLRWESGDIHRMKSSLILSVAHVLQLDPMFFFQHEEVLLPEEKEIVDAYRCADSGIRASVRILLGVKEEKKDEEQSAI